MLHGQIEKGALDGGELSIVSAIDAFPAQCQRASVLPVGLGGPSVDIPRELVEQQDQRQAPPGRLLPGIQRSVCRGRESRGETLGALPIERGSAPEPDAIASLEGLRPAGRIREPELQQRLRVD